MARLFRGIDVRMAYRRLRPILNLPQWAERQAKAMAAWGELDHDVAGSIRSNSRRDAESAAKIFAAGTKTGLRPSADGKRRRDIKRPLQANADSVGVAVARNEKSLQNVLGDGHCGEVARRRNTRLLREKEERRRSVGRHQVRLESNHHVQYVCLCIFMLMILCGFCQRNARHRLTEPYPPPEFGRRSAASTRCPCSKLT